MGYGPDKLSLVLGYLPKGGHILDLGAQAFHGRNENRGAVGDWFEANGYRYACVDIRASRHGDSCDLNTARWSDEPVDVVTNFGTTEHLMDQVNAFRFVHDACRVGGWMLHEVPHCRADHGLINYNTRFFSALAKANGYEIDRLEEPDKHVLAVLRKRGPEPFQVAVDMSTH